MKYAVEMGSGAMTYTPSFMKIGSAQWFSNVFGSRRTYNNFLAHFVYKIKNISIFFKL
jgi:hypothetical protein